MAITGKYYSIPIIYDDDSENNVVIYSFNCDASERPDYTADGYGTGTGHYLSEILLYLKEKITGFVPSAISYLPSNNIYEDVLNIVNQKLIPANSNN